MPTKKGSNLEKNPFQWIMELGIVIALTISKYVMDALNGYTGTDPKVIALKAYYTPKHEALVADAAKKETNVNTRIEDTKTIKKTIKDFGIELNDWVSQIIAVHKIGSEKYDLLMMGGRTSFTTGSREAKALRMETLAQTIGTDLALAALKAQVIAYHADFNAQTGKQTVDKTTVGINIVEVSNAQKDCAKGLWYVYCQLIMVYIDNPLLALAFFPMTLIYKAEHEKRYGLLVPAHTFRKICIHLFKVGETVTLSNKGLVALQIALSSSSKTLPVTWYILPAGTTITINFALLGNISNKFMLVKNVDLTENGSLEVIIHTV